MTQIATLVYVLGILGLFWLERDGKAKTSKALWLPVAWLLLNGSRPVSVWLHIAPASSPEQYLEGSPLDRNVYLSLIAMSIGVLWGRRQAAVKKLLNANPALVTFILYCAISTIWSEHPDVAFKRWIKYLGDVVMVLVVLTERDRLDGIKRLLARVGFILVPVSILLIKYYPDMARYYSRWEGRMFVSGVAEDKNMLGMTCLVFGLGAWWRMLAAFKEKKGKGRTRKIVAHGVILAMVGWLLWMANSMTSISCFLMMASLVALGMFRFGRKPAMVHLSVAAIVCVSFSVLFLNIGGGALQTMGRNPTLTGRTEIWQELLKVSSNPLIGTGFQSFWIGENLNRVWSKGGLLGGINESHNAYLEVFLNVGGIGVILLAVLILVGYRNAVTATRQDPDLGRLRLAFFITAIVYGFTEAAAFAMLSPIWFAFLLATMRIPKNSMAIGRVPPLAFAGNPQTEREPEHTAKSEGWWTGKQVSLRAISPYR